MGIHNKLTQKNIILGFIVAGLYNWAGILGGTQFFTRSSLLATIDPIVFSWLGQIAILLWGLAYWSVSRSFWKVPYLIVVFFLAKMLYTAAWLIWLLNHYNSSLPELFAASPVLAVLFAGYGLGDFLFGVFFGMVAWKSFQGCFYHET